MTGKKKNEIWAVILSIVVILEMILSPCQVAYASTPKSSNKKTSQTKAVQEEEAYTVKVTDSKQQPIKGAKISYEIYTDATGESVKENVLNLSVMTDAEGTAKILPISTLQKQDSEVYYRITEISAYGYEVYKDEEVQVVNSENVLTERDFVLSETKVSLTGRVTNQSDNTPLEGALVTAGEESTYTNENGDYTILLFFNTEYEMVFSMDGFESATTKFTITGQNSKCNAKLTKSPVYDPNFIFETENPETIIYGTNDNKFSNPAISAVGTEISVKYAITEEKNTDGKDADVAEIDEKTGEVTIKKAGTVKVEATRAGDAEYDETKISYTLTILKANQTGVKFAEQSPKDCYLVDLKNKGYTNILEGGESSGTVTYKIIEGQDFATIDKVTGKLTFNKAGKVVVEGTKAGDDCYESQSASYSITTLKKNQTDGAFKFEITNPSEFTYNSNENKFVNTASGGEGNGKVTYQIIQGNEVADIDSNSGELTINKAGTVKVQATKIEDEDYESATAVYTLEVSKAQQNNLHFVHAKTEISWNQNGNKYGNELDGGSGTGIVSYKIVSEKNLEEKEVQTGTVATINAESGELAILSTGIIEVQAIKAGDDCYEEAAATYKLTINKATQKIEFAEKNISLYYGKTDYAQSAKEVEIPEAADGKGVGTGSIAYSIDGENPLNAKIDKKTGKVTFVDGKIGTITVKAVKAEDEKYQKCETSYQLQVSYLKTSENLYTLSGEKADAKNDWYIGNIKITAKDGYQISYSNKLKENNWTTSVTYDTEGTTDTNIYLREEATGAITDAVKLSKLKIDKGNPTNLKIEYKKESLIDKFKDFLFGKKEAEVILTAKDDVSGIASFKYQYQSNTISLSSKGQDETEVKFDSSDKNWKKNEDGTVSYTFKIKPQFRGNVSFKAIDNAGNVSTQIEDKENTVVVDDTKPEVNISYQAVNGAELKATVEKDTDEKITRNNVDQIDENTRFIYNGTVEATIEVKEANFFKEDVPLVIKRDGKEIWNGAIEKAQEEKDSYSISDWTVDEKNDKATCTIQLKADGDYQVGIAGYQDRAGNEMKYKDGYISNIITVDTTAPELKVTYDNNDVITNADEDYYQSDRTATVQVTDRNFRPSEVDFSVISKNVQGKNVTYQYSDLKDWGDWKLVNKNTSTWEAEIPFNVDARYDVSFKYTDLAGHELTKNLDEKFVVDKTDPEISVRYSDEVKTWKKVLHAITFGYYTYQANLKVILTAKDETAGVDYIEWAYNQEENTSKINKDKIEEKVLHDKLKFSDDKSTATTEFTLTASETEQFRGSMSYSVTDRANRSKSEKEDNIIRIVDNIAPVVDISYSPVDKNTTLQSMVEKDIDSNITRKTVKKENVNDDTRFIYDGAVKATIKVKEANFFEDDAKITLTCDGKELYSGPVTEAKSERGSYSISEWKTAGQDTVSCEITFEKDGDYQLKMDYSDSSDNEMSYTSDEYENKEGTKEYTSNIITVDTTAPELKVTYDNNDVITNADENYYQADRTATVQVTDRNFRPSEVDFNVEAKNVNDEIVKEYQNINSWDDWSLVEGTTDTWEAKVPFDVDARYHVTFDYTDLAGHELTKNLDEKFIVDKMNPDIKVEYSKEVKTWKKVLHAITFGYYTYQADLKVTLTAKDETAGVDYIEWAYNQEENTSKINKDKIEEKVLHDKLKFSDDKSTATTEFTLKASETEQFRGSMSYSVTDRANRSKSEKEDNIIRIVDNMAPIVDISYNPVDKKTALKSMVEKDTDSKLTRATVEKENVNDDTRFIYDGAVKATIKVKEANFFEKDAIITLTRDGKELYSDPVTEAKSEKGNYSISEWKKAGQDTVSCEITFEKDGDYQLKMDYSDSSDNEMSYTSDEYENKEGTKEYTSNIITVDTVKPQVKVTYDNNSAKNGNYYKNNRTATICVTERNFRPSEVDFSAISKNVQGKNVTYQYSDLKDWGDWKLVNKNTSTWEAEVPFNVDARYDVSFKYTDLAGHNLEKDFADAFIVDKEAPNLNDMKISYSTHIKTWQKVLHAITFGYYSYKEEVEVTLTAKDDISGIDYLTWTYKQEANTSSVNVKERTETISKKDLTFSEDGKTATGKLKLKATNKEQFRGSISFIATDMAGNDSQVKNDSERVNIVDNISPTRQVLYPQAKQIVDADTLLTKSEYNYGEGTNSILYYDGDVTVTFKVTEANFYAEDVDIRVNNKEQAPTNWQQSGDTWTGSITLSGDGDYVITMTYTDRSTNQMQTYQSEKIVIDTINPVINVSYGNGDVKKTAGERQYFNKVQTATISITEHNFRADDVAAVVTAKDVNGADVSVTDFARYLSNRGNWTRNGDVYSANITYDADANYTFDIDYKDLALRNAADYKEDQFTVDKTAPSNLKISYSEPVKNQTIGALPYRFYKQLVTVTISAEDNTSGVDHFVYSYRKASGVSSVNAELIDAALANSQITKNGSKFTSSFTIPRSALGNNNQFNGTVDFVAHDTATNTTDLKDSSRTVVDNISPTASVTYNKPVQEVNGISYYSGKIDVTVQINEANFYAEDVQISVAKDGANGNAMTASWSNNSTDVHTGTFSLSEDGDYIITINYTDRSTNKMETYTSKQLTIDTKHPTIHVSNIKVNSANKDETYGFTITATDTADNFTSKEFKPVLEAVTRSENGSYEKKEIPLGDINTNKNNQEYSITVENLEEDGIYTLTCSAKDLANNEYKKFTLDDEEEYESVSFSINRNGSTFLINKDTENLINQYYVYDVNEDLIISEINTDPVENYTVKLNGKELEEDTEYTTETSSPEDEWSVRKYTIDKDLFDTEGEYNIVVESVDKTETSAYSDVKGLNLSWVVDQTAPIVAVSGLENDGRYKTKEQVVTAIPTDDGGKLKSFKVVVSDKNKKNSSKSGTTLVDLTGDKLEKYLDENDGKVTFKVPEGYQENVRIICTDYAAHKNESETNTYDKVFSKVTVSPSNVVIFYANKPLFYGSIAGVIVVLGGGIIFFIWRRRRENGKQQEE